MISADHKPSADGTAQAGTKEPTYAVSIFEKQDSYLGKEERLTWQQFLRKLVPVARDNKDGVPLVLPAELRDDHHPVTGEIGKRRTLEHVVRRTMIFVDVDSKETDEVRPPQPLNMLKILEEDWGGAWALYTSHSHSVTAPRYRICIPIDPNLDLPPEFDAVTPVAERLGLTRWMDRTKRVACSMFYLPSHPQRHAPISVVRYSKQIELLDAEFYREHLERFEQEQKQKEDRARIAAESAAKARAERIATGGSSTTFLEKARDMIPTVQELLHKHGYERIGRKWLHPGSTSGIPGIVLLTGNDGIERVYSHNWKDPIHTYRKEGDRAKAHDNFDLLCLFEYGEDWSGMLSDLGRNVVPPSQNADPLEGLDDILNKPKHGAEKSSEEPSEGQQEGASATGLDQPKQSRKLLTATPYVWRPPEQIPPRRFIYGKHLIRGFVSGTIAPGGMGKSTLIMVEALDMATGGKTLGIAKEQFRVWTFNGEDPHEELERKVAAAMQHYDIKPEEIGDRLFMDSGHIQPLVIAEETRDGAKIMLPVVEALVEEIRIRKLDVLQLDPFVSVHHVSENDNNKIDAVVKTFSKIAHATGCAIDLVHHSRKTNGQEVTAEDSRGASSLISAARSARVLNRAREEHGAMLVKAGETFNPRSFFSLSDGKKNLAPQDDKSAWYRLASVMLANGDNVGVVEAVEPVGAFDGLTENHLTQVQFRLSQMPDGMAENIQAEDWIGQLVSEVTGLAIGEKGERSRVSKIIATWIGNAALEVRMVQNPRSRREQKRVFVGANRGAGI